MTAPERIWATINGIQPSGGAAGLWRSDTPCGGEVYVRADLAAVPAQVRVKPLVWTPIGNDPCAYEWKAAKPFGSAYYILRNAIGLYGWVAGEGSYGPLEAAKAAAQADYEARILAALEPQPDPRDAQIAALVDENNELRRRLGGGCDANNGLDHLVISEGKYKFCGKCGETLHGVRFNHMPRAVKGGDA